MCIHMIVHVDVYTYTYNGLSIHVHVFPVVEDAYRIDADVDGDVAGLDILDTAGQVSWKMPDRSCTFPADES